MTNRADMFNVCQNTIQNEKTTILTRATWNDTFRPNWQQILQFQITKGKPANANNEVPISTIAEHLECQTTRCPATSWNKAKWTTISKPTCSTFDVFRNREHMSHPHAHPTQGMQYSTRGKKKLDILILLDAVEAPPTLATSPIGKMFSSPWKNVFPKLTIFVWVQQYLPHTVPH